LIADLFGAVIGGGTLRGAVERCFTGLADTAEQIKEAIRQARCVGFDETGVRIDGKLHWWHTASTPELTHYHVHPKRGQEGIEAGGILPGFGGRAMHDAMSAYFRYGCEHALCNAHHLRELQAIIEQDPHHKQTWARQMDRLLRDLQLAIAAATDHGHDDLDVLQLAGYRGAYQQILATGYRENPLNTIRTGQRGCIAQTPARNLLNRLDTHREDVLRFAHDFQVPFDNNLVERDIRMVKLQQKISGCWRTSTGAEHFLALRAYLSTTRKQGRHILDALTRLAAHDPWIPQAASPNTTTTT
jgi:transposase